ncbi:tRNA (guanine37-N1)-methyltransferase [Desulfonauticus submarinus]|uniref:tRNA (guanine-N(1)-)-methyltransferase n=1 Tax=Desulfonauticus submarinus TaxID=206665 RepID=A0A1H0DWZ5_9BACT|nr:tRNA (guanosine(37)-N1)-methyltransferase TrmD [Desulfonauticus submarinus]SDN74553.1 tRNA (guanine37-N1)-methyltransferase [Desulfonauticus submarinus]
MTFYIITLFPEYFASALNCGQLKKAREKGLIKFIFINPRDFTEDKHKTVDDKPYGGGAGMVMMLPPLDRALQQTPQNSYKILLSPKGKLFSQEKAKILAKQKDIVLICGRYEGIDARLEEMYSLDVLSVGDYVLNGGESAALNIIEAISRLLPGFMSKEESFKEDSFFNDILEYPHYTRPEEYKGYKVPQVLLSGHHSKILKWKRQKSLEITLKNRPELLIKTYLNQEDREFLKKLPKRELGKNLYLTLLHYPVLDKFKKVSTTSLTNLDIHDISRVSCTYGLGGYFLVTPLQDQQKLAKRLLEHWTKGPSSKLNTDRARALELVEVAANLDEVVEKIKLKTGQPPVLIATSAREGEISFLKIRKLLESKPVLLILGTGHGLAKEILKKADFIIQPICFGRKYNHLSVRSAAAIMVDRILGEFW